MSLKIGRYSCRPTTSAKIDLFFSADCRPILVMQSCDWSSGFSKKSADKNRFVSPFIGQLLSQQSANCRSTKSFVCHHLVGQLYCPILSSHNMQLSILLLPQYYWLYNAANVGIPIAARYYRAIESAAKNRSYVISFTLACFTVSNGYALQRCVPVRGY